MTLAQDIKNALEGAFRALDIVVSEITLEHPGELVNGDYATGVALQYAKEAHMKPRELAEKIVSEIRSL